MKLFDVYPLYPIEPVKGSGSWLWDDKGEKYLDLYGGHAVISIGHNHPHYNERITAQLTKLGFYSNAVQNSLQGALAEKLGKLSGYDDYQLFLCSSGAEANENALKLASFVTGKKKVIAMEKGFHGRTSGAVAATDNPNIVAPFNAGHEIVFVPMNDAEALEKAMDNEVAAIIIEGLQGVAGIYEPTAEYLASAKSLCESYEAKLILDEVQSGAGRTGHFFAHQSSGVTPDIITLAKGLGNGFPVGAVLIAPDIEPKHGMLGTTFGGNHLACAAALAVLEVIEQEKLMENAADLGEWLIKELGKVPAVKEVRGKGLMLAIELAQPVAELRKKLLFDYHIFTGSAGNKNTLRLLPSLAVTKAELTPFIKALKEALASV
ncbi:aspartate aminotransferase family protein [Roseivirga pacifica]|uniref:aspartate aminotransferase family protein n=1 Tax=Roseivirga pacifica TaxID=1267423 RepID=UPI00209606BB|nr:aminotransferase class III-fold pyridoxal phosphate-dependent enzyme [Roseivirga pacifica]MCO6358719.1 aminotransferase class III-fold pyridoxal phosphate-dependent enzyme [Roseivirga pacifica]MCO6365645.1 aminotransferase class III-fold pyridoxal phosphate-dependent enzyme [Roseivirga pacifica]MCO6371625.1 aminotransferase class III-fold pyridoxal phosphate-dependent enzyme [Roseivirga pacifica]MCO6376264.1 aminotransferase class III-fold pyridoxal phosphate-dependent enzyme [Roseivirga pac